LKQLILWLVPLFPNAFHLREDLSDIVLTENLEIHVIELRKLKELFVGMERRLMRWMLFLSVHKGTFGGVVRERTRDAKGDDHARIFKSG